MDHDNRYCSSRPPHDHRYEPWSIRRTITTWVVAGVCLVALAIVLPVLRDANERSWCSGGVGARASQRCLDEQKALRCGPLGILHCPSTD